MKAKMRRGKTGYMTEANGLNADQFIAAHLRDDRFCMYTANDAIQYDLRRVGHFSDKILVKRESGAYVVGDGYSLRTTRSWDGTS